MKVIIFFIGLFCLCIGSRTYGQAYYDEIAGNAVIKLPSNITKMKKFDTSGSVIFVFENVQKHVQGSISEIYGDTSKGAIKTFYETAKNKLLENETTKMLSSPHYFEKKGYDYVEADAKDIAAFDDMSGNGEPVMGRYLYLCVIKVGPFFYKIICYSPLKDWKAFKPVFQKIALSLTHYYTKL